DFTIQDGDLQLIRDNRLDFLAISYYNSNVVSADKNSMAIGDSELNPYLKANPWGWTINPLGLYDSFLKYWDRYHSPLMIAENGFGQIEELDENDTVHDDYRIDYLRQHLQALKNAVEKDVDVFAYCAWSPIDMVSSGTSEMKKRYGFIYNDLNDDGTGSGKRYPKDSFYWYQKVIASNGISI
ncbi:MAG: family 1 glycosylhydrolase, partial [Lactobacillus sp.]|nr:family 1 glycosylhydrolase [Lactobacillus sp.]